MTVKETTRSHAAPSSARAIFDLTKIAYAAEVLPWRVTDLPIRPFPGLWSMNPSLHFDGETWRCVVRCSDYALPGGVQIQSETAIPAHTRTLNALVILDPTTWQPISVHPMRELDGYPRSTSPHTGFEDMRIFRTASGGLQGIAASHQLAGPGAPKCAEQVLLSFDDRYNVVAAKPIRGDAWSGRAQKNWVPFDGCDEPRFLYAIEREVVFDARGPIAGWPATPGAPIGQPKAGSHGGTEVVVRRKTIAVESGKIRSRSSRPEYAEGLRGGSQLIYLGADRWLGIAHERRDVNRLKHYWHTFYSVDSNGRLLARSAPIKLAAEGIEFAAGLVIDGDRVVISFGVDDMHCRIGQTALSAVLEALVPIEGAA